MATLFHIFRATSFSSFVSIIIFAVPSFLFCRIHFFSCSDLFFFSFLLAPLFVALFSFICLDFCRVSSLVSWYVHVASFTQTRWHGIALANFLTAFAMYLRCAHKSRRLSTIKNERHHQNHGLLCRTPTCIRTYMQCHGGAVSRTFF